jgi:D-sedoheptulose 7-phosphate isomerase
MSKEIASKIKSAFEESINLKKIILKDELLTVLEKCGTLIANSISEGGKLMTCGNGGSAADAQHLAAELLVRLTSQVNRKGLPAISLCQDISTLTATINDFSGEEIFSRNLLTLTKPGDVLMALSTSGNSPNIVKVLKTAKEINLTTIGFLGAQGGDALGYCDEAFIVPSNTTARVQEIHITAGHATLQFVEDKLLEEGFIDRL